MFFTTFFILFLFHMISVSEVVCTHICRCQKVHWDKYTWGGLQMQNPRLQDSLFFQKKKKNQNTTQKKKTPKNNHHHHDQASRQKPSKHNPSNHSCSCHHSQVTTAPQWQPASSQTPVHQFQVGAIPDCQQFIPAPAGISETHEAAVFTCFVTDSKAPIRETSLLRIFLSQKEV